MDNVQEINIPNLITSTINELFLNLFNSIDSTLYSILDDLVFISTDIINHPSLSSLVGDRTSGIILIANSLVIGFLLYYGISHLLSHFTFVQSQNPYQLIFRLLLCVIFMNFAIFICWGLVLGTSTLSLAIRSLGEGIFDTQISFASIIENLNYTTPLWRK